MLNDSMAILKQLIHICGGSAKVSAVQSDLLRYGIEKRDLIKIKIISG